MPKAGIVGLPNVGKSTLFNALTRTRKAEMANYPFCTIEPNVGVVEVPDERLASLSQLVHPQRTVPAVAEVVDIAGLVKGASRGEGLGNQFLAHIREVDTVIQVVRCFRDNDVPHNMGSVDPLRDIEVVRTELILADLQSLEGQMERTQKKSKSGSKEEAAFLDLLRPLYDHLNGGLPARSFGPWEDNKMALRPLGLLTAKPVLYACNVSESDLGSPNPWVEKVRKWASDHREYECSILSAKLESELSDLSPAEVDGFLKSLGVTDSGVSRLIQAIYRLLGLASFFTAGEKEVRAWTFHRGMTAAECAGLIHTDFQKGFVKAEVIAYEDFMHYN
ncbi:MAG: redox-regulated ATPase YchF, partial [Puniceicoccales bacterium]|nr:redox-regulated ATPase YchF [Puniceicoccales bacterium]